ncbi:MAG: hypothetical protein Q8O19_02035, partial [Rectinemataceae bacterium]|nr:hypothetical protein [Rectinemataceae bacterium]
MVVMTELKDSNGKTVVAAVHINRKEAWHEVHNIDSVYGKDSDQFFADEMESDRLLYLDKKKSAAWSSSARLYLPLDSTLQRSKHRIYTEDDLVNDMMFSLRPNLDHSLLSPSGKVSGRAKDAAMKRFSNEQDAYEIAKYGEVLDGSPKTPQPSERENLERRIKELEDLANRGMSVAKFRKEANRLRNVLANIEEPPEDGKTRFSLKDLRETYDSVKNIVGDVVDVEGHEGDMSWFDASPLSSPEWVGHKGVQVIVEVNLS